MAKLSIIKNFVEKLLNDSAYREAFEKANISEKRRIFGTQCGATATAVTAAQADRLIDLINQQELEKKLDEMVNLKKKWVAAVTAQIFRDGCPMPYAYGPPLVLFQIPSEAHLLSNSEFTAPALLFPDLLDALPEVSMDWRPSGPYIRILANAVEDKKISLPEFMRKIQQWIDMSTGQEKAIYETLRDELD